MIGLAAGALAAFFAAAAYAQGTVDESGEIEGSQPAVDGAAALLRALDTIVGTTTDIQVPVGEAVPFLRFSVSVSSCRYRPESPATHSYAFVTISEKPEQPPIFDAWMISSSPALSAMEHPRYDIWLVRCSATAESVTNG
ncbi:MAG: DUF2155 domain-containing protein [Rhodobacteraceae bacterium]|nr:DUF2155 domain-containing protein [Paracoccaceae bacterium]